MRQIRATLCLATIISAAFALASSAQASVLYNSPSSGFDNGYNYITPHPQFEAAADTFTLGAPATVVGVQFDSWTVPGDIVQSVDWVIWDLLPNTGGNGIVAAGNAAVSSVHYVVNLTGFDINIDRFSIPALSLTAGVYWLELFNAQTDGGTLVGWDATQNSQSLFANSSGAQSPNTFEILGPDPDRGGPPAGGVPEPATWALLIAGFGSVGVALRRSRASSLSGDRRRISISPKGHAVTKLYSGAIATACAAAALATASFASAAVLYDNGPINGTIEGWTINHGYAVSNAFTLSSAATVTDVDFGVWTSKSDTLSSVDWAITATPGSYPVDGTAAVALGSPVNNDRGFDVTLASFSTGSVNLAAGTYYLVLQNAVTANNDFAYWDINNGPSVAYDNAHGAVDGYLFDGSNSNSFQILETAGVPEPASWALMIGGFGLAGASLRRRRSAVAA
jgi:PEP-CTERM motif